MNNYDTWKNGGYEKEDNREFYTEEQLLLEKVDILESKLEEANKRSAYLASQLKELAKIELMFKTFGKLESTEIELKNEILSRYERI